jgi:hypothetical protein
MHQDAFDFVKSAVDMLDPEDPVYEIGGKNINGSVRPLFVGMIYLSVDIRQGPGVDIVANAASFRPPFSPKTIVCCEVLEHVTDEDATAILGTAMDIMAPGGLFIITAAGTGRAPHSAEDGGTLRDGEFYRNVTKAHLEEWLPLEKLKDAATTFYGADIYFTARKK